VHEEVPDWHVGEMHENPPLEEIVSADKEIAVIVVAVINEARKAMAKTLDLNPRNLTIR